MTTGKQTRQQVQGQMGGQAQPMERTHPSPYGTQSHQMGQQREDGGETAAPFGEVIAQNDIADMLYKLADMIGGGFGDFLRSIADFFENLSQSEAQALADNGCMAEAMAGLKQDAMENLANMLSDALVRTQALLNCFLGNTAPQAEMEMQRAKQMARQAVQENVNFTCLWKAAQVYFQTKNWGSALMTYFQCSFMNGGNGETPTGDFHGRPVKRPC